MENVTRKIATYKSPFYRKERVSDKNDIKLVGIY